jgi:hypothetical protein
MNNIPYFGNMNMMMERTVRIQQRGKPGACCCGPVGRYSRLEGTMVHLDIQDLLIPHALAEGFQPSGLLLQMQPIYRIVFRLV